MGSYAPAVGGLAIHAENLVRGLAGRGHRVTVLTAQADARAPRLETRDGIRVVRVPVRAKIARIPVMPSMLREAVRLIPPADVVSVHTPLVEAGVVSWLARRLMRAPILTCFYDHEDASGLRSRIGAATIGALDALAMRSSRFVVVPSQDYAERSPVLKRVESKLRFVAPVIDFGEVPDLAGHTGASDDSTAGNTDQVGPVIAMAARIAPEKGTEYLLRAIPLLLRRHPRLRVRLTGSGCPDAGCERYFDTLRPLLERHRDCVEFTGVLARAEVPAFLAAADVVVVPSVDAREAFGMVQVEAMLCGTPVVASDLPGMREPVMRTGMGVLVAPRDPVALADAICDVVEDDRYQRPPEQIAQLFGAERTLDAYEELMREASATARFRESHT